MKATPITPTNWNEPQSDTTRLRAGEYDGDTSKDHFRRWRPPLPIAVGPRTKPVPNGAGSKARTRELANDRRAALKVSAIVEARRELAARQTAAEIFAEMSRDLGAIKAREARMRELAARYCKGAE